MSSHEKETKSEKKKLTLKERLKDKREKAKLELMIYGIFFLVVIIFVRVSSSNNYVENNNNVEVESFVLSIKDNYEYDTVVTINDDSYHYYGKVLGNNSTINIEENNSVKSYYLMNKKYYVLEDDNYILADSEEIYPYIDYRYMDVEMVKEYLEIATKEDDVYTVKVSDILLNSESEEEITIYIEEGDKNVVIDYTNLFKITKEDILKVIVNITYSNIDSIISLDE